MSVTRSASSTGERPEAMRVWLLGGFKVSVGLRTVDQRSWRLKKAATTVKLLALSPGHRIHREQVMEALWPHLGRRAASNNLRRTLHAARRALDPTARSLYLTSENEQLVLCPNGNLWVDMQVFEEAASTARRSRDPAAYRAAIDLYSGDLLPEERYEAWTEGRREELRQLYLALLVELAGLYEERTEYGAAIETLLGATAKEPTLEEAHAALMRLHALSGRPEQALSQYERLTHILSRELGTQPGDTTMRVREEILDGRLLLSRPTSPPQEEPPDPGKHNLPAARTTFVGRERAMVEVKRMLAMTRLLTLMGTGGSGKSRLALEVATDLVSAYPDGVRLVELAPLSEPSLVTQVVCGTLGVREQPNRPLADVLIEVLRGKEMLLVLDNCEHLVDAVASLVDTLLATCPKLRVLATSREALNVQGESRWTVPALSLPDPHRSRTVRELEGSESVRLFVERASQRDPAFALDSGNVQAVAEVCRRLDGIPLALELAAARVRVLTVDEIASRLENSLTLLTDGGRTALPRQRTLRGTLDWSYELLSEVEKKLFGRLSIFAGGWTLEAGELVGAGDGIDRDEVLDLLSKLVDKSLVVFELDAGSAPRYRMLEPVRQYAQEKLEELGDAAAVRHWHAEWYLAFAMEAEDVLIGPHSLGWLDRLETEHDNLRAALANFIERGDAARGLRLAGALGEFWRIRGHLREGLRWLEAALATDEKSAMPARVKVLTHAGWIAWELVDFERSAAFSKESLALSRKLGDTNGAAFALYNLGMVAIYDHMRADEAWALFEESLALRRELGDKTGTGRALQKMGLISVVRHDFGLAEKLHEESLGLAHNTDDKVGATLALWLGGLASLGLHDYQSAWERCTEGLILARQGGYTHAIALMMHALAALAGVQGQPVRSARLWGAAESTLDGLGFSLGPAERSHYAPYVAAARARLDEKAWEAAWAEGKAMPPEDAIDYALSGEERPLTTTVEPGKALPERQTAALTRREHEVAMLVARGLPTNRQIAAELFISQRTAETHMRNILKKLELGSRAELAAWATERALFDERE
jgi:predicted ATPase/DNA-binding SARP family transcriptional activator/DNA-binding CsgD family transcriptional regulator